MFNEYLKNKNTYCVKAGESYKRPLFRFKDFIKKDPLKVTLDDIFDFCEHLKIELSKHPKGDWTTTYSYTITIVKDFLKFCGNPVFAKVKVPKIKFNPYHPVSREEFDLMDDYLDTEPVNFANDQRRLMLHFLFWTAVRVSELISINWSKINLEKAELYISNRKNTDGRWIFWPKQTHELLIKFIEQRKQYNGESLFVTYEGRMNSRCVQRFLSKLGITVGLRYALCPHCFRQGRAHDLFNHGADIKLVKEVLGHKSYRSTERYLILNKQEIEKKLLPYLT